MLWQTMLYVGLGLGFGLVAVVLSCLGLNILVWFPTLNKASLDDHTYIHTQKVFF